MTSKSSIESIKDKDILLLGNDYKKVKRKVKEYITEFSKMNHKIILLDSFWSEKKYDRFINSRFRKEIERRYHIKLSVQDFLDKENVFEYMNDKEINIIKIKSINGYMSAAELFPVILSKINEDVSEDIVHLYLNDFVLKNLTEGEFLSLENEIKHDYVKLIVANKNQEIIKPILEYIDHIEKIY
ncbi:MAG: hypothetical protein FH753_17940 [Firmicutes bacterium]|nr:hypothetical protein [Bacillota bacterium]